MPHSLPDADASPANSYATGMAEPLPPRWARRRWIASLLAVAGAVAAGATLDDPGITVDEPINRAAGAAIVDFGRAVLAGAPLEESIDRAWGGLHEHPPLSRALVGVCERYLYAPRLAAVLAYALTVWWTVALAFRCGAAAGGAPALTAWASGIALLTMPRLFAHAHFAAPEMVTAAAFVATVSACGWAFDGLDRRTAEDRLRRALLAGIVTGVAMLAKLTVLLAPATVLALTLVRHRRRAVLPLLLWGAVAWVVFVQGWPWLWPLGGPAWTLDRLGDYLNTGLDRATIYTWYFGRQYPTAAGVPAPWHYALLYFLVTVPVVSQVLGVFVGLPTALRAGRRDLRTSLVLGAVVATLAAFSLPIDRYDGERLFLFAFPPWAIVIGLGAAVVVRRLGGRPWVAAVLLAVLAAQVWPTVRLHPFQLSYYSAAVGGLAGAERLGLEATYWGDTVNAEILDRFGRLADEAIAEADRRRVSRDGRREAVLVPTLHASHPRMLDAAGTTETVYLYEATDRNPDEPAWYVPPENAKWAVLFNRAGYLQDPLARRLLAEPAAAEVRRDGVWLARVVRLPVQSHGGKPAVGLDVP